MKVLVMQLSQARWYFIPLQSKYSHQHMLSLCSLSVAGRLSIAFSGKCFKMSLSPSFFLVCPTLYVVKWNSHTYINILHEEVLSLSE
jgi:hypothetical protein